MELEALRTRKSVFQRYGVFLHRHHQAVPSGTFLLRINSRYKAGQPAKYSVFEVVQRWIAPDGRTTTVARLRSMSLFYYDLWNEYSDMEVRKNQETRAYDITPRCTYPPTAFHSRSGAQRLQG